MSAKIVILGGSSPFTAALVDALADKAQRIPPGELVLQGRTVQALELLSGYAGHQLGQSGWKVGFEVELDAALDGADVVVHQIRYGGMEGRHDDERLAAEFSIPPDETLGPAGLQAALRAAPELRELGNRLRGACPQAWMLNLTNPLSVSTAILARAIGPKCVGLCELPWHTVREACRLLDVEPHDVRWHYQGLNHRGFIYRLTLGEEDLLARLAKLQDGTSIGGIGPHAVREVGALPLKYFRLMLGQEVLVAGRAEALARLRSQILAELAAHADKRPPSLALRDMPWYDMSVAPVLGSILRGDGGEHVINVLDGPIVRELPCRIASDGPTPTAQPTPGESVRSWLDRFAAHEKAVMAAVDDPSEPHIAEAVSLDPLTPASKAAHVTQRLADRWSRSNAL
ncbi:MAG: 6-phospho-beta-glucosidase [Planctomycetota bacterium]|nr:MAG: 6-phospho-beta-glucosidase [Planctomycetota bacterium]